MGCKGLKRFPEHTVFDSGKAYRIRLGIRKLEPDDTLFHQRSHIFKTAFFFEGRQQGHIDSGQFFYPLEFFVEKIRGADFSDGVVGHFNDCGYTACCSSRSGMIKCFVRVAVGMNMGIDHARKNQFSRCIDGFSRFGRIAISVEADNFTRFHTHLGGLSDLIRKHQISLYQQI